MFNLSSDHVTSLYVRCVNERNEGTYNSRQVTRATMALSDRGIALAKHRGDRATHDVAATQNDGVTSCDGDACGIEQSDHT